MLGGPQLTSLKLGGSCVLTTKFKRLATLEARVNGNWSAILPENRAYRVGLNALLGPNPIIEKQHARLCNKGKAATEKAQLGLVLLETCGVTPW